MGFFIGHGIADGEPVEIGVGIGELGGCIILSLLVPIIGVWDIGGFWKIVIMVAIYAVSVGIGAFIGILFDIYN